ncbi:MAG: phosphotransferase [Anaerolineae bacterium]
MDQIRVTRSFVAGGALGEVIDAAYDLGSPVWCRMFSKMLRTQDNDHYLVRVGDRKLVARVYQQGDALERQESDYLYELEWLDFLREHDIPVAYPIRRKDGRFLGSVSAPEGKRHFALFHFAEGRPMSTTNEEQLYRMGVEMARIHVASNEFQPENERQPINLEFLVEKSLERVQKYWAADRNENLELILASAQEARAEIDDLISNPFQTQDGWGPIGGDFHNVNTFFDENGEPGFFNFDWCGPGWRSYDIATFLQNTNLIEGPEKYTEAFFAGYYSVRPLSNNEHAAISPFLTIRRVWLTGLFTMGEGLAGHTFIAPV